MVFLSFADVKGRNFKDIRDGIISCLSEDKDGVKAWYDGFTFGTHTDIYNPWSITNFLDSRDYGTYWADTSSNGLISRLLLTADAYQKKELEILMKGGTFEKVLDEQIIFLSLITTKMLCGA